MNTPHIEYTLSFKAKQADASYYPPNASLEEIIAYEVKLAYEDISSWLEANFFSNPAPFTITGRLILEETHLVKWTPSPFAKFFFNLTEAYYTGSDYRTILEDTLTSELYDRYICTQTPSPHIYGIFPKVELLPAFNKGLIKDNRFAPIYQEVLLGTIYEIAPT